MTSTTTETSQTVTHDQVREAVATAIRGTYSAEPYVRRFYEALGIPAEAPRPLTDHQVKATLTGLHGVSEARVRAALPDGAVSKVRIKGDGRMKVTATLPAEHAADAEHQVREHARRNGASVEKVTAKAV